MSKRILSIMGGILILGGTATIAFPHCQIPCGIYGDETRFELMREHITTIEKSMKQIELITKNKARDDNQLVRWILNKDSHAVELAEIVTFYFMAQRVKPVPRDNKADHAKYVQQISLLHQILVFSMKTKQSMNIELCAKLRDLVDKFEESYTGK